MLINQNRIALLLLTVVCALTVSAQIPFTAPTENIVPATPESSRIVEYQSPRPLLSSGTVNFSIPVYTVSVSGVTLPVSLDYATQGIRLGDDAYPVGYGWSIQPALRVTRQMRGRPDERYEYTDFVGDVADQYMCAVGPQPIAEETYTERYDSEYDVFTIALPGQTSQTWLLNRTTGDTKRTFFSVGHDEYKVTADINLDTITVVDGNGIIYRFGGQYKEIFSPEGQNIERPFPVGWMLYDIEATNGDHISIGWMASTRNSLSILGGGTLDDSFPAGMIGACRIETPKFNDAADNADFSRVGEYGNVWDISRISFRGGQIEFEYSSRILSAVKVKDPNGQSVKTLTLNHETTYHDVLLTSVTDTSADGVYSFEYYPTWQLSMTVRQQRDRWGYYNGKAGNDDVISGSVDPNTLTPYLEILSSREGVAYNMFSVGRADRSIDGEKMKAGMLRRITYPTGGYSAFEYEPHKFAPSRVDSHGQISVATDPELSEGGGLRVKRITSGTDSIDVVPVVREYTYDDAHVATVPSAATFVTERKAIGQFYSYTDPNKLHSVTDSYFVNYRIRHVNHSSNYAEYEDGSPFIYYGRVTETCNEGKTEYYFEQLLDTNQIDRSTFGYVAPRYINRMFSIGPVNVKTVVYKNDGSGYRAVETSESHYKTYSAPKFSLRNTAVTLATINTISRSLAAPHFLDGIYLTNSGEYGVTLDFYNLKPYRSAYYLISLQSERLESTTKTLHTENGDYITGEKYTYVNGTSIPKTIEYTGGHIGRKLTLEYATASNGGIEKKMVDANITASPISAILRTGSTDLTSRLVLGDFGNRLFLPTEIKTRRGTGAEYSPSTYTYDHYGNLTQVTGEDGYQSSYVWDSSGRYLNRYGLGSDYDSLKKAATAPASVLTTDFEYKPLVGVSVVKGVDGTRMTYTYDNAGRLSRIAADNRGNIAGFDYTVNAGGRSFVRNYDYRAFDSSVATLLGSSIYDGLGRQTISVGATGPNSVAATLTEYDSMGHAYRSWMTANVDSDLPTAEQIKSSSSFGGDSHPYAETVYEPSPRGQVSATIKAGDEWHNGSHSITCKYYVNTATECPLYAIDKENAITFKECYPKGTLLVEEMTDEEGAVSRKYTDCRGLVVMTRQGRPGEWLDTRYIYNDLGDLVWVLPPAIENGNHVFDSDVLVDYAYFYRYDDRGRCVYKRLPGGVNVDMRYDVGGRICATRDANMYADGRWMLYVYDRHGREALRLIVNADDAAVSTWSKTVSKAVYGNNVAYGGYNIEPALPAGITIREFLAATYYDTYDFSSSNHLVFRADAGVPAFTAPASAKGKITGRYLAPGIKTAYYYDRTGQVAQTAEVNYGVYSKRQTLDIDNRGNVLYAVDSLYLDCKDTTIVKTTRYTYNSIGQLTERTVSFNGNMATTTMTYNGEGRVGAQRFGNRVTRSFDYDIRGWLTKAETYVPTAIQVIQPLSDVQPAIDLGDIEFADYKTYTESIHYADGVSPRYDGLISSRSRDNHTYTYSYDCHKRLISADYSNSTDSRMNFSESYGYDAMSSLTSLLRYGVCNIVDGNPMYGSIDKLGFSYKGNRIDIISASPNTDANGSVFDLRAGYGDLIEDATNFYTYDANGNMNFDDSRDISSIEYNVYNMPTHIEFKNGDSQTIEYDGAGNRLSVRYIENLPDLSVGGDAEHVHVTTRRYIGDYVFETTADGYSDADNGAVETGTMQYARFDGGYFDRDGVAHYLVPDFQGNTAMDIDADSEVVQETHYYPYGEPWSQPTGQPWLFGGKERERRHHLGDSDFGARTYNAARSTFAQPDPLAERYYHINPYTYCAADPINHTDPSGCAHIFTEEKGKLRWIGSDGIRDNIKAIVDKKLAKKINKLTRQGASYTEGIANTEHMAILPTFNDFTTIATYVRRANDEEHETGASKDADGFIQMWNDGGEVTNIQSDIKDGYVHSIVPFKQNKGPLPFPQYSIWYFHVHSIVSGYRGFGKSNPSQKDMMLDMNFRNKNNYKGTTFVIGGKNNEITFYYGDKIISTLSLNELMGEMLIYKIFKDLFDTDKR